MVPLKSDLAEVVANEMEPIQKQYFSLISSTELDDILNQGKIKAEIYAKRN